MRSRLMKITQKQRRRSLCHWHQDVRRVVTSKGGQHSFLMQFERTDHEHYKTQPLIFMVVWAPKLDLSHMWNAPISKLMECLENARTYIWRDTSGRYNPMFQIQYKIRVFGCKRPRPQSASPSTQRNDCLINLKVKTNFGWANKMQDNRWCAHSCPNVL
ncbi:uncharacterized protein LOC121268163 [Juglans microcarpa x Juglans regia]|uniref:uncharacterized protein LOC121268163 n=1 Tax=Juglans microcarpa x Juglans regia TaxID=2249226 RepID=UPI001B7F767D|nr:uncharacterized protein LOC121268163 [Juglans microcarpa x Juglans regia]